MVKLGIYGLLRVALDMLGGGPAWWGASLVAVGAATALTGVLYALVGRRSEAPARVLDGRERRADRAGHRGGLPVPQPGAAGGRRPGVRGGTAARREPRGLQGRAVPRRRRRCCTPPACGTSIGSAGSSSGCPWTAATFLVGAMAIAALPPFNGFVSEWLLFQSFLPGVASSRASIAVLLTLGVGALALTGGLAAATFVKAFGISFLAIPRSPEAGTRPRGRLVDARRHADAGRRVSGAGDLHRSGSRRHRRGAGRRRRHAGRRARRFTWA